MKGYTGLQSMGGYDPLIVKNHSLSTSQVVAGVKQKKAVPGIKDNRQLLAEQLSLLDTIQGEKASISEAGGVIQGRIPNFAALDALHRQLSVDVIKEKVKILLTNLHLERLILQGQSVDTAVDSLIRADGRVNKVFYEQLFGKADGTEDKGKIYHDAKRAKTGLNKEDMQRLGVSIERARGYVEMTRNSLWVNCIFGSKSEQAGKNYDEIMNKLLKIDLNIKVTTDYNGDSEQWGIGGYADCDNQTIHFLQTMCGGDPKSPITAIHECAHLVDSSIGDLGYVGSPGFELMSEEDKINNAAHYEIVPCWVSGLPCPYPSGTNFKEFEFGEDNVDIGKKQATDYFQKAHLIAFNYADKIRRIYSGERTMTPGIIKYSEAMGLMIHSNEGQVTLLDVTLAENIAHVLVSMYKSIRDNKETIGKYRGFSPEVYKAYFKNMVFKTCLLKGVTWRQVYILNTWNTSIR